MREIISPLSGIRSPFGQRRGFSPFILFAGGEEGVWYDPSDLTTLFQDTAGTTPVTTPGQTVGLMLDKSKGLTLEPELFSDFDLSSADWGTLGSVSAVTENSFTTGGVGGRNSTSVLDNNKWYKFVLSFTKATATSFSVVFDGVALIASAETSATLTFYGRATNASPSLYLRLAGADTVTINNISVRELPGYHATQSSEPARPKYGIVPETGRRNLLGYTEQFDNAVWVKSLSDVTIDSILAPNNTLTADKVTDANTGTTGSCTLRNSVNITGENHIFTVYAKRDQTAKFAINAENFSSFSNFGASFDLDAETVSNASVGVIENIGNGWFRCGIKIAASAADSGRILIYLQNAAGSFSFLRNGEQSVFLWGAQLEVGSTATAYQRVTTDLDVTEAGVPSLGYLSFDGVDDVLISPSAVFFGEASSMMVGVETFASVGKRTVGTDVTFTGLLVIVGPFQTIGFVNNYTSGTGAVSYTAVSSNNRVISWLRSEPQNSALLRVDGTGVASTTHDQADNNSRQLAVGGNTFGDYGAMNFFSLVHIARFINDAELSRTERYIAQKTGVTL